MDLILLNEDLEEIGPANLSIDVEIGDSDASNDFEIETALTGFSGFYVPDTEIGGLLEYTSNTSTDATSTLKGWTWRGLLTQWIIEPPSGSDYRIVSGEANTIIRSILSDVLGGFFTVPETSSGLTISSYQFKLYTTVLEGLTDMLSDNGYRLDIRAVKTDFGGTVSVQCKAVKAERIEGEYNEDSGLQMTFTDNRMGINHLVCMGKGELQARQRVDLYINNVGKVSQTQYYYGFDERKAYYDYSSVESEDELVKQGTAKLKELASAKKLSIKAESVDLNIGDIVVGRYREAGLTVEAPINKKIYKVSGGYTTIEYGVKGDK